mgnify:CR=1 FL=1
MYFIASFVVCFDPLIDISTSFNRLKMPVLVCDSSFLCRLQSYILSGCKSDHFRLSQQVFVPFLIHSLEQTLPMHCEICLEALWNLNKVSSQVFHIINFSILFLYDLTNEIFCRQLGLVLTRFFFNFEFIRSQIKWTHAFNRDAFFHRLNYQFHSALLENLPFASLASWRTQLSMKWCWVSVPIR